MRGLDTLIRVREAGRVPPMVTLQFDPYDPDALPFWLQIEPHDKPAQADLRPLVGLWVHVDGYDAQQVQRWADAVLAADASTVIATVYRRRGECVDVVSMDVLKLRGELAA